MVPADTSPAKLNNTSHKHQPISDQSDCSPEDQEVVLQEIEGNTMDEAEPEHESRGVYQTTITLNSAAFQDP